MNWSDVCRDLEDFGSDYYSGDSTLPSTIMKGTKKAIDVPTGRKSISADNHLIDGSKSADLPTNEFLYAVDPKPSYQRRLIKWSLPPPSVHPTNLPRWRPTPYGLEKYWQFAFVWFFRPYLDTHQDLWTLQPVELPPASWPWNSFSYMAKVHFKCPFNHPGWTSNKGLAVFWFRRQRRQNDETVCEIVFKLYGQQCSKCCQGALSEQSPFQPALWYPEFIEEAVRYLSVRVDEVYYGGNNRELRSRISDQPILYQRASSEKPSKVRHGSSHCQACLEGLCVTFNS